MRTENRTGHIIPEHNINKDVVTESSLIADDKRGNAAIRQLNTMAESEYKSESTDLALITECANAAAIPTDLVELQKYIEDGAKKLEIIQAVLNNPVSIAPEMMPRFYEMAWQAAENLLQAQKYRAEQIKALETSPGCHNPDIPTKKKVLVEMGLSKTQAWKMEQLNDTLILRTKEKANRLKTLPTFKVAMSVLADDVNKAKKIEKAQQEQKTFAALYADKKLATPDGPYDVIFAAPPYQRSKEKNPSTMTADEIKAVEFPVSDTAVLFLMTHADNLLDGLDIMKHWGFEYQTHMVYDTDNFEMNSEWFQVKHKLVLVGAKGNYPPPHEKIRAISVCNEYQSVPGVKYKDITDTIEGLCPQGTYLDVFANRAANGHWATFTKQDDDFDNE